MRICKKCTRDVGTYLFCPHCGTNQSTSSLTLGQVYSDWSALYYRKIGKKTREGYENAWKTLRMLEHLEMLDITVHDYQAAMDKLTRKSRSLQNKLLLLIGQLCNYATEVHRMEVVKPSSYLVLDGIESKSREIFSDEEISRLFFYANQNEKFSCTAREVLLLVFTGLRPEEFFSIQKEDISLEDCYIFSAGSKTGAGRNRLIPLISQVMPYKTQVLIKKVDEDTGEFIQADTTWTLYEWNERNNQYEVSPNYEIIRRDDGYYTVTTLHSDWEHYEEGYLYFEDTQQDYPESYHRYSDRRFSNQGKFLIVESKAPAGYYGDYWRNDEPGTHSTDTGSDLGKRGYAFTLTEDNGTLWLTNWDYNAKILYDVDDELGNATLVLADGRPTSVMSSAGPHINPTGVAYFAGAVKNMIR